VEDGDRSIRVTVSVGLANYHPERIRLEEDLVRKADDALYTAKEGGRNRVVYSAEESWTQPGAPTGDLRPATCAVP
ncbi:diguanylate cyclase, partial [bacterium]|nr:diguanylate cyclase [bacterium]